MSIVKEPIIFLGASSYIQKVRFKKKIKTQFKWLKKIILPET